jgi:uncharacterized protein (DUF1800 family)
MELHTLGVNGGYTQADVTQVARVLTGWTVDARSAVAASNSTKIATSQAPRKSLAKRSRNMASRKAARCCTCSPRVIPRRPEFISRKLAIRFVGDDPPQALVDRMAKTYLSSGGDISAVLKTLFKSPEFWSTDSYRAKVKTPLEYRCLRRARQQCSHR